MFDEVIALLQDGKGKEALHKLKELLHHHEGGVSTNDSGGTSTPPHS